MKLENIEYVLLNFVLPNFETTFIEGQGGVSSIFFTSYFASGYVPRKLFFGTLLLTKGK